MTPAETLAAARLSPVGPYVPARVEWLEGWTGPVEWLDAFRDPDGRWVVSAYGPGGMAYGAPIERIRLDLRRPEVRDHLVRCGCPSWARDCAPAVWAWAGGVEIRAVDTGRWARDFREPEWFSRGCSDAPLRLVTPRGWSCSTSPVGVCEHGPETGADGRACVDLAAIRARCVLEEADGWYVPLVGGGVGWWPKNLETP